MYGVSVYEITTLKMVYTRRSKKLELQAAKVNTTERSLAPAVEHFIWSTERKIALFQSMINRKPAGKFLQIGL